MRLVAADRASGVDATVETCPHYLALDENALAQLGPIAKCAPPLRGADVVEDLWRMLLGGLVDFVASDHSPCPLAMKEAGNDDIWQAWGGINGVQTLLAVLLAEGVHRRGLPLPDVVRLTSANPARRFDLYPRKGSLRIGADADIVLVDLDREWILEKEHLRSRWRTSPFVGRRFHGAVEATLVRGAVVYQAGQVIAQPGYGQLIRPARPPGPRCRGT